MKFVDKYKLTYFALYSQKPVNLVFKNIEDLHNWSDQKVNEFEENKCVYLFVASSNSIMPLEESTVFVTEHFGLISDLLSKNHFFGFDLLDKFSIHEYESFEDAYAVALGMKEGNPLCYNDKL